VTGIYDWRCRPDAARDIGPAFRALRRAHPSEHNEGPDMRRRWRLALVGVTAALALAAGSFTFAAQAHHTSPTWSSSDQWGNRNYGAYTVYNNIWGSGAGSQTVSAVDQSHWWVDANHPNTGGIKSYPNVSYTLGQPVSSMPRVTSSVSFNAPTGGNGVAYTATYDVWGNGHDHEIMIWLNKIGPVGPLGRYETTVNVGGHTWDYYRGNNGANEVYSFVRTTNTSSATVDITAISQWLYNTGRMPNVRIDQIQFGYEITSSSGGHRFSTTNYQLNIGGSSGPGGTNEIVGAASNRCLDVPNSSTTNGVQLQLWDCHGGNNQRWTRTSSGELRVLGKCLDAEARGTTNGTRAILWDCNGGTNQRWNVNGNGTITSALSGLCLDASGAGTANGTRIILWSCNGGSNQRWTLR
jgi:hypothetical protein